MITESAILIDSEQNTIADKQRAELYQRVYKYAAEDFVSHPDLKAFAQDVLRWMKAVESTLEKTHQAIASHKHIIPPHAHRMPPHNHFSSGGPTSSNMGAYMTMPTPITTPIPNNPTAIRWSKVSPIKAPGNTTGTQSNMSQNRVSAGIATTGDVQTGSTMRRMKTPSILAAPALPPYMSLSIK